MPQFKPDPLDDVRQQAERGAKSGEVARSMNGLAYVVDDLRPMHCFGGLIRRGWYVDSIWDNPQNDEFLVVIAPVTKEVLE